MTAKQNPHKRRHSDGCAGQTPLIGTEHVGREAAARVRSLGRPLDPAKSSPPGRPG
jgi:hypothetical protein